MSRIAVGVWVLGQQWQTQTMRLLVRNLDRSTTESDLKDLFEAYGAVQSCTIVTDAKTGRSKGFGFVEMPKVGDAKAAVRNLNGTDLDGERIRVKNAKTASEPASGNDG